LKIGVPDISSSTSKENFLGKKRFQKKISKENQSKTVFSKENLEEKLALVIDVLIRKSAISKDSESKPNGFLKENCVGQRKYFLLQNIIRGKMLFLIENLCN
jgi:hypothetical protein